MAAIEKVWPQVLRLLGTLQVDRQQNLAALILSDQTTSAAFFSLGHRRA